jgi:hypothetical protein
LNIDRCDDEAVLWEQELIAHFRRVVQSKHGRANHTRTVLVELVELHLRDHAAHTTGNSLARVADEIGHAEDARSRSRVACAHIKVPAYITSACVRAHTPIVAELQLKTRMIGCLDSHNVRAKVGTKQQTQ